MRGLVIMVIVSACLSGCPGSLKDPERFTMPECPPGTDIVADVFQPQCGSSACHGAGDESGGNLDLISPGLEARVVDVPSAICAGRLRIDSRRLENSFFIEKLGLTPECGDPMPRIGVRLSRVELACVQAWAESLVDEGEGENASGDGGTAP